MKNAMWKTAPRERRYFVGGSDARIIMGEDEAALVRLWREKRGEAEPEDLSGNLIVQLGLATEDLNRHWYEANTGRVAFRREKSVALLWEKMPTNHDRSPRVEGALSEPQKPMLRQLPKPTPMPDQSNRATRISRERKQSHPDQNRSTSPS